MNFEEFKKGFERLCRSLGGKLKKEQKGITETITCYDIPKGQRVDVDVHKTKTIGLVLRMLGEELELEDLNVASLFSESGIDVWATQERGYGAGTGIKVKDVKEIMVSYDKEARKAYVDIFTH